MAAFAIAQLPVAAVVGGSHSDSGPGGLEERVHVLRGRPGEGKAEQRGLISDPTDSSRDFLDLNVVRICVSHTRVPNIRRRCPGNRQPFPCKHRVFRSV